MAAPTSPSSAVQVALRVRPLSATELLNNNAECVACIPEQHEVLLGADRNFVFDYVFDPDTRQQLVYQECVQPLIQRLLDGYNATIIAYGQTGSGKTFSMGTGLDTGLDPEQQGVIPRSVQQIFESCEQMCQHYPDAAFEVYVSFLELYNETLIDLLCPKKPGDKPPGIREDKKGGIEWVNVKQVLVKSPEELYEQLRKGSLCRTTGSTDMNLTSSRSHAVFSITLHQRKPCEEDLEMVAQPVSGAEGEETSPATVTDENNGDGEAANETSVETAASAMKSMRSLISKFHFVDLAGSERLKRTNAQGGRKKEGIAINAGLLALGNVISALCHNGTNKKTVHVPYRDSKLTRMLQDSLGGNSQTLMLACISPAEVNFGETLSTLRYASRARKIQNRVRINTDDPQATQAEVQRLRKQLGRLQTEFDNLRNSIAQNQLAPVKHTSSKDVGDEDEGTRTWLESQLFKTKFENERLKERVKSLEGECITAKAERDTLLFEKTPDPAGEEGAEGDEEEDRIHPMVRHYVRRISELEGLSRDAEDELAYWREVNKNNTATQSRVESVMGHVEERHLPGDQSPFKPLPPFLNRAMSRTPLIMDTARLKEELLQRQRFQQLSQAETGTATPAEGELDEGDEGYLEEMLRRINASIVMREGLMQQIEQLQEALASKEDLVLELEEARYVQTIMEEKYLEKIENLQEQLTHIERERDELVKKLTPKGQKLSSDVHQQYEEKMKWLVNEITGLRRESNDVSRSSESAQKQSQVLVRTMTHAITQLKQDKQRMAQRMKELEDRSREIAIAGQKELQALRRKERLATDAMQKLERQNDMQKIMLKRQQEENIIQANKLKSLKKNFEKLQQQVGSQHESKSGGGGVKSRPPTSSKSEKPPGTPDEDGLSGIKVTFKRQLLEREISLSVAKRQISASLEEMMGKYDRLVEEKRALMQERDLIVQEEMELHGDAFDPNKPQYMDDRIELIDAEAAFISARIRGLGLEAAQLNLVENGAGPLGRDAGYENALNMLSQLNKTDTRLMLRSFLDDVIRLRVEQWSRQSALAEMEKSMMDLRRTLLVMRKTAVTAAAEYERRLQEMERPQTAPPLGATHTPSSSTCLSAASTIKSVSFEIPLEASVTVYDKIYERGILNRAVRSIEQSHPNRRPRTSSGEFPLRNNNGGGGGGGGGGDLSPVVKRQLRLNLEQTYCAQDAPSPTPSAASELGELCTWWADDMETQLKETEAIVGKPVRKNRHSFSLPRVVPMPKRRTASGSTLSQPPLMHRRSFTAEGPITLGSSPNGGIPAVGGGVVAGRLRRLSSQEFPSPAVSVRRLSDGVVRNPVCRRRLSDGSLLNSVPRRMSESAAEEIF